MKLRSHLVVLVMAVLVPMIVFAAIVVAMFGRQQRADVERGAVETARALINAVDESLNASVKVLESLATSQALQAGDLRAFHAEARRAAASQPDWFNVVLLSAEGQQLVNTLRPFGAALPRVVEPGSHQTVVSTARPAIGGVSFGPVIGEPVIGVRVPVIRNGAIVYVLTAGIKPSAIVEVLRRQRIPEGWVSSVFDWKKTIAARTRSQEQFIGKSISEEFVELLDRSGLEGWAITHTLEGAPVYTAFARSPATGWGIGIGLPTEAVDAPLYRSFTTVVGGGIALVLVALLLATLIGRRITTPIGALASAARRFGESGGMPAGAPATVTEVEDVRRAFAEAAALVEQRAAEARDANRAKDEFLAVLSHELRTPLNAVYGWARMLQGGQLDETTSARALDVIVRQANAQLQLIDDLLDVSRVITGKMRLDVRLVELKGVIEGALDAVRPAADAKEIRLHTILDPRAGPVHGDPDRLQQIVWNLVMNAVKFTPKGGRVQVALQRVNSHVELIVSDTGRGIDPEVLPYVFERFRQGDSSTTRAHAGLGLGLALARHLVDLHGGSLTAHSDGTDKGATFVVKLPLALAERVAARGAEGDLADGAASAAYSDLTGVRVLLVDDDPDALELGTMILSAAGADVRVCRSVADALVTFERWRPHVLISDIEMPGENGYTFIRKVRARGAEDGGRVPAVALTAYGRTQDRTQALTAGFSMHVPKPVDPGELTAIVASLAMRGAADRPV
jgi:signal transduction histidine kinase/ActR/RegA family two-component response regulator